MTDMELKEIEAEVMKDEDVSKAFEITFLENSIEGNKNTIRQLQCSFRIHKYVRDDEKMYACKKDIKKIKDTIQGMQERLAELQKDNGLQTS